MEQVGDKRRTLHHCVHTSHCTVPTDGRVNVELHYHPVLQVCVCTNLKYKAALGQTFLFTMQPRTTAERIFLHWQAIRLHFLLDRL
jgi:hypothetical protein